jgi:hypothetical protein
MEFISKESFLTQYPTYRSSFLDAEVTTALQQAFDKIISSVHQKELLINELTENIMPFKEITKLNKAQAILTAYYLQNGWNNNRTSGSAIGGASTYSRIPSDNLPAEVYEILLTSVYYYPKIEPEQQFITTKSVALYYDDEKINSEMFSQADLNIYSTNKFKELDWTKMPMERYGQTLSAKAYFYPGSDRSELLAEFYTGETHFGIVHDKVDSIVDTQIIIKENEVLFNFDSAVKAVEIRVDNNKDFSLSQENSLITKKQYLENLPTDFYSKSETYTKTEVDNKISSIPPTDLTNYYTKNETYNQSEVDGKISSAISSIPATDLTNYYTKNETLDVTFSAEKTLTTGDGIPFLAKRTFLTGQTEKEGTIINYAQFGNFFIGNNDNVNFDLCYDDKTKRTDARIYTDHSDFIFYPRSDYSIITNGYFKQQITEINNNLDNKLPKERPEIDFHTANWSTQGSDNTMVISAMHLNAMLSSYGLTVDPSDVRSGLKELNTENKQLIPAINELKSAIDNVSLTPGPTGPQGPAGPAGGETLTEDWIFTYDTTTQLWSHPNIVDEASFLAFCEKVQDIKIDSIDGKRKLKFWKTGRWEPVLLEHIFLIFSLVLCEYAPSESKILIYWVDDEGKFNETQSITFTVKI